MKASGLTRTATLLLLLGSVVLACAAQDRPSESKDHPKQDSPHQQAKPADQHEQQPRPSAREEQPARQQQRQPAQSQKRPAEQQRQPAEQQQRQPAQSQKRPAEPQQRRNDSPQRAQGRAPQEQRPTASRSEENTRQERGPAPARQSQAQQRVRHSAWQQHRAGDWQSDHRTWQQRGGYNGYRIPGDRFRGYFGPEHGFRIEGLPFMVVGGYPRFEYDGYWLSVVDPWPSNWGDDWYDNDQVYVAYVDNGYYLYNRSYPGVGIAVSISM
jgi:hypothetical protein